MAECAAHDSEVVLPVRYTGRKAGSACIFLTARFHRPKTCPELFAIAVIMHAPSLRLRSRNPVPHARDLGLAQQGKDEPEEPVRRNLPTLRLFNYDGFSSSVKGLQSLFTSWRCSSVVRY